MSSPKIKSILVLAALCGGLLPFQNCTFSKPVGSTGTSSAILSSAQGDSTTPSIGSASNGNGYDGKVFVNRGVCGKELFAVQSAVKISNDGSKISRVVENCNPVNHVPISKSQLTVANSNTFVMDGNIHNFEFEGPPRLAGKVHVIRGDVDQLILDDGKNFSFLKLEDNFLKIDYVIKDADGKPYDQPSTGYKLMGIGSFGTHNLQGYTQFIFKSPKEFLSPGLYYYRQLNASRDTLSRELTSMGYLDLVNWNLEIVGSGSFIAKDAYDASGLPYIADTSGAKDQLLFKSKSGGFKVMDPNLGSIAKFIDLKYIYAEAQSTVIAQESDKGFVFLGVGRFSKEGPLQPVRKVEDALQIPVDDPRVLAVPSASGGAFTLESKGQSVVIMRKNQRVVAIANVEGGERDGKLTEIIFEENNTLYMLRHLGAGKLGSVTLGNLVNPAN